MTHFMASGLAWQASRTAMGSMFFMRHMEHRVHWQPQFMKQSLITLVSAGHAAMSGQLGMVLFVMWRRLTHVSSLPGLAMQMYEQWDMHVGLIIISWKQ